MCMLAHANAQHSWSRASRPPSLQQTWIMPLIRVSASMHLERAQGGTIHSRKVNWGTLKMQSLELAALEMETGSRNDGSRMGQL